MDREWLSQILQQGDGVLATMDVNKSIVVQGVEVGCENGRKANEIRLSRYNNRGKVK